MPLLRIRRVDYSGMVTMARELARYSATTVDFTLTRETASVIKICAIRARVASQTAIKKAGRARADYEGTKVEVGKHTINVRRDEDREWFVLPGLAPARGPGGNFRMVYAAGSGRGWHLSDEQWTQYLRASGQLTEYRRLLIARLLARRGLQLLSWVQISDALGVSLETVSPNGNLRLDVARAARGAYGQQHRNGTATVTQGRASLVITIRNESPLAIKNQGQAQLDRAVQQRLNGFRIAVSKGVLDDLQLRAARWRGIFVRPA